MKIKKEISSLSLSPSLSLFLPLSSTHQHQVFDRPKLRSGCFERPTELWVTQVSGFALIEIASFGLHLLVSMILHRSPQGFCCEREKKKENDLNDNLMIKQFFFFYCFLIALNYFESIEIGWLLKLMDRFGSIVLVLLLRSEVMWFDTVRFRINLVTLPM